MKLDTYIIERTVHKNIVNVFQAMNFEWVYIFLNVAVLDEFTSMESINDRISVSDLEGLVAAEKCKKYEMIGSYGNDFCLIKINTRDIDTLLIYVVHLLEMFEDAAIFSSDLDLRIFEDLSRKYRLECLVEIPAVEECLRQIRSMASCSFWSLFPDADVNESSFICKNENRFFDLAESIKKNVECFFDSRVSRIKSDVKLVSCAFPVSIVEEVNRYRRAVGIS